MNRAAVNVCRALSYIHAATHAAVHCAPKGGEEGGGRAVQEESNHVGNSRIYTRNEIIDGKCCRFIVWGQTFSNKRRHTFELCGQENRITIIVFYDLSLSFVKSSLVESCQFSFDFFFFFEMINKDIVKYYAILWIIRNVAVRSWEGQNSKKGQRNQIENFIARLWVEFLVPDYIYASASYVLCTNVLIKCKVVILLLLL